MYSVLSARALRPRLISSVAIRAPAMGVGLVPTPKAPKNRSLAIRFIAKVLSTAHAPIWSRRPRAQNAGYGEVKR